MASVAEQAAGLGLDTETVDALLARAAHDVETGALPSCQLALARHGELAVFATFGDAAPGNRYLIYSVTKALTAAAVWVLFGDGAITPETRVAQIVPEFATNRKDRVTLEHVMTHTAGFPRAPMRPLEGADRAARVERFRQWRLHWEPGTRFEYHPTSADWVLAEVIARVSGDDHRVFLRERVTVPLGLPRLQLGCPAEDQRDVLDAAVVGEVEADTLSQLSAIPDSAQMLAEVRQEHLLRFNDPAVRKAGVPGTGAVGTAADLARYFQALLRDDGRVWEREVLTDATANVRNRHPDPWTTAPANRTLGLVVAGDDGLEVLRGFGEGVGPRTFGTSGIGGQVAWADPDSGLSFCYLTNGLDADPVRAFRRQVSVSTLAAGCAR